MHIVIPDVGEFTGQKNLFAHRTVLIKIIFSLAEIILNQLCFFFILLTLLSYAAAFIINKNADHSTRFRVEKNTKRNIKQKKRVRHDDRHYFFFSFYNCSRISATDCAHHDIKKKPPISLRSSLPRHTLWVSLPPGLPCFSGNSNC